jgi:hypothetical protein
LTISSVVNDYTRVSACTYQVVPTPTEMIGDPNVIIDIMERAPFVIEELTFCSKQPINSRGSLDDSPSVIVHSKLFLHYIMFFYIK